MGSVETTSFHALTFTAEAGPTSFHALTFTAEAGPTSLANDLYDVLF